MNFLRNYAESNQDFSNSYCEKMVVDIIWYIFFNFGNVIIKFNSQMHKT